MTSSSTSSGTRLSRRSDVSLFHYPPIVYRLSSNLAGQFAVYGFRALAVREINNLIPFGQTAKLSGKKPCRAWTHKEPGQFTSDSTVEEVARIMAIPSRARQRAAEARTAEIKQRTVAWLKPTGRF